MQKQGNNKEKSIFSNFEDLCDLYLVSVYFDFAGVTYC